MGNGPGGEAEKEKMLPDIVDAQIDVTGRAFLALTLACARCHDHKFDPIPTADYYGLAGIFFSSHILDQFASKTAGEKPMRIPLLSAAELARRDAAKKRLSEIDARLANIPRLLSERSQDASGKTGLIGWRLPGADTPVFTVNPNDHEVTVGTVKLPARSVALHPGPKLAATAVWRSPESGAMGITVRVRDADPNCGDGIEWAVIHSGKTLGSGVIENGRSAGFSYNDATVAKGDLLQFVIRPRANHLCDTTEVDFKVRAQDGRIWDLAEAFLTDGEQRERVWRICAGEGTTLAEDLPEFAQLDAE